MAKFRSEESSIVAVDPDSLVGDSWTWDEGANAYVAAMDSNSKDPVSFFENKDDEGSLMFAITAYDDSGIVKSGYASVEKEITYTVTLTLAEGYTWADGTDGDKRYTFKVVDTTDAAEVPTPTTGTWTSYEDADGNTLYYNTSTLTESSTFFDSTGFTLTGYTATINGETMEESGNTLTEVPSTMRREKGTSPGIISS